MDQGTSHAASINPQNLQRFKVVFLGDQATGKTSIVQRFLNNTFAGDQENGYAPTVGIDFITKTIFLEDRTVRLQLWDTAGMERFRALVPTYIRDSSIAIVVFDLTDRRSFLSIPHWMGEIERERGGDIATFLVGNKLDLESARAVSEEEGQQEAEKHGASYVETSAKTGANIKALFRNVSLSLPGVHNGAGATQMGPQRMDQNLLFRQPEPAESGCAC
ncbi:Small GTPase superfamily [Carpediemonas membranifera]|uniref:Small GTPase superfamily n=1 Tax=Carpediemonas membranifera TaxID=201153 RepID=A0A8J6B675_9EUKA|nr:Small GTPase superfamily [Carpediemonas membranifera]|eukprot:KAG9395119.1 Small GTPase superfamily [Carpediemonas membranifera]